MLAQLHVNAEKRERRGKSGMSGRMLLERRRERNRGRTKVDILLKLVYFVYTDYQMTKGRRKASYAVYNSTPLKW
jgi:hypothetical protein